jgi:hypothetical protein
MRYILVIQLILISLNVNSNPKDSLKVTTITVNELNCLLDCVKESRKDLELKNDSLLKVIKKIKQ